MRQAIAILLVILGGALLVPDASAAEIQFWEQFGVDWKLPVPGLKLYLEKQIRYEKTFTNIESDHTEIGIGYKAASWISFRANFRFISVGPQEKRDRVDGNIIIGWSRPAFEISNRARLQKEFITTTSESKTQLTFRDQLRVTLRPGQRLRPFAAGEIFLGLGADASGQNKLWIRGGCDYDITGRVTLTAFYLYERDISEKTNESFHIVGAKFKYSF